MFLLSLVCFFLFASPVKAESDKLLIDAVYKLMIKVQALEKELRELKEKQAIDSRKISALESEVNQVNEKLRSMLEGENKEKSVSLPAGKDGLKVVVGTFFSLDHANRQLARISGELPFKVYQKETDCRGRRCWINYVVVRPEEIPKIRRVIPDAYVVSLKLKSKLKVDATKDAIKDAKDADANAANQ